MSETNVIERAADAVAVAKKASKAAPKKAAPKKSAAKTPTRAGTIEVQAGPLAKALKQIDKLVEVRNTIPILSMVMIEVLPTGMKLSATDLDIWAADFVEASCHASEIVRFTECVSARKLFEAVSSLDAEASVRLTMDGSQATARLVLQADTAFGPVEYRLPTLPAGDYPEIMIAEPEAEFEISAFALNAAFEAVRQAISTEETRYYLNGVFMHVPKTGDVNGQFVFAATDGHRLARHRVPLPDGAQPMPDIILPRKAVALIQSIIGALGKKAADIVDVSLSVGKTKIAVTIGTVDLICKLIDGTFPDYTRVIPTKNDKFVTLRPAHLAAAVKQVRLIGTEKTRAVKCAFESGRCGLSVHSPENGTSSAALQCDYAGDALTIGFNAAYLLDILAKMGGAECMIEMADAAGPTLLRNYKGASTDYVLMPMRV